MKENLNPTQKEKNLFWASSSMGMMSGLLAGLFAASFYDFVNLFGLGWGWRILYTLILGAIFIGIMFWLKNKIVPVNLNKNEKRN